ncbi:MAG: PAS domain-containing sensor histidine kinase [Candidatus Latescibacterota bacterium]
MDCIGQSAFHPGTIRGSGIRVHRDPGPPAAEKAGEYPDISGDKTLFDNLSVPLLIIKYGGEILECNRSLCNSLGFSRERILSAGPQLITNAEGIASLTDGMSRVREGESATIPIELFRSDKESRLVEMRLQPIFYRNESAFLAEAAVKFDYPADITSRKEQEEKLLACRSALRSLAADLSLVEENERRMIAADIHDCVNQTLAAAQMKLEEWEESQGEIPGRSQVKEARKFITEAIRGARNLSFELCPPILHEQGISVAAEWLAEHFQAETGIRTRFNSENRSVRLAVDIETLLYKSLRELLYNIRKHSRANNAYITIWRDTSQIYIRVEDDGVGFDAASQAGSVKRKGGFGLFSIRERLRYVGGDCTIESVLSRGTRCTVFAPWEKCS